MKRMGAVIAASVTLAACGGPMSEGLRPAAQDTKAHADSAANEEKKPKGVIKLDMVDLGSNPATSSAAHFKMDSEMEEIVSKLTGSDLDKIGKLHAMLNAGAGDGVKPRDMTGQPPRTASEALDGGGDCTDLANLAIALQMNAGIPGGALIVRFDKDPPDMFHMVSYAEVQSGKKVIVDLQSRKLGKTADGSFKVLFDLSYEKAAYVYPTEQGDYHKEHSDRQEAIKAYEEALQYFDGDPYVHHNLGVLYEREGDFEKAARHLNKAAELNPAKYKKSAARGSYNLELKAAYKAYEAKDWAGCAQHFKNAKEHADVLGGDMSVEERMLLVENMIICEKNHRITSGAQNPSGNKPRLEPHF